MKIYALRTKNFCYVGSTKNIRKRFYNHRGLLIKGIHSHPEMNEDVIKNGAHYITIGILEECEPDVSLEKERDWIIRLSCSENVLNRRDPITQNWKDTSRLGKHLIGKKLSEEHRRKISEGCSGHRGRKLTKEDSERIRSFRTKESIEKLRKAAQDSASKVINNDTGKIYETAKRAAEDIGVSTESIRAACRGSSKFCRGHRWSYHKV